MLKCSFGNRFLRFCTIGALLMSSSFLFAQDDEEDNDDDQRDQAIEEYINLKRQITVKEISGALSISGEVHAEFQDTSEKLGGHQQRSNDGNCIAQGYDVEFDLLVDYRSDRNWASVKIKYDNTAGNSRFSGECNQLCLDRAYMGARIVSGSTFVFDTEVGRNKMGRNFDSRIEFSSFFDGILFRYDRGFELLGDGYLHAGAFLINEKKNHFGYVGELGWLNIKGTGLYSKLSLIDWDTKHYDNSFTRDGFRFVVGQWLWGYKFYPEKIGKRLVVLYGAYLYNFAARRHTSFKVDGKRTSVTHGNKENYGAYLGFTIGQLKKKNDFSFDANYQVVAAQAVPDFDSGGIGLGNCNKAGVYSYMATVVDPDDPDETITVETASTAGNTQGKNNFRGFQAQLDYLFTDNIMISTQWQQAMRLEPIGPTRSFSQFELELIYTF